MTMLSDDIKQSNTANSDLFSFDAWAQSDVNYAHLIACYMSAPGDTKIKRHQHKIGLAK